MAPIGKIWEVVGGSKQGGIIARAGRESSAPQLPVRLAAGSLVEEFDYDERTGRIRFELVTGTGPKSGWATIRLHGKELLVKADGQKAMAAAVEKAKSGDEKAMLLYGNQLALQREQADALKENDIKDKCLPPSPYVVEVKRMRPILPKQVTKRLKEHTTVIEGRAQPQQRNTVLAITNGGSEGKSGQVHKAAIPFQPSARKEVPVQVSKSAARLNKEIPITTQNSPGLESMFPWWSRQKTAADLARDLEPAQDKALSGRFAEMCPHCNMALGDFGYPVESDDPDGPLMHGECKAQLLLLELKAQGDARSEKAAEVKKAKREEYKIGWKMDMIPRNVDLAGKLGFSPVAEGMSALVLSDDDRLVKVVPTIDPATSINLEYLTIALQVRRQEGREPLFSLDPRKDAKMKPGDPEHEWQVKHFEPAWLAGTSAGEVMFQADIHLKELSMGEYEQPVVGMKSCFDYSQEESPHQQWNAREWFVIQEAEMHISEDNVLIPSVKLGVEARETIKGPNGMEDKAMTRPDHPMVKYAEAFTRNFDLIAERKSVIHHLRELAKATALAKFLDDSVTICLEKNWFTPLHEETTECINEVPQLWNERCYSSITVNHGKIVGAEKGFNTSCQGVYGGVQFGLDRFALSAPTRRPAIRTMVQSSAYPALRGGPTTFSLQTPPGGVPPPSAAVRAQILSASLRQAPTLKAALPNKGAAAHPVAAIRPMGVDLNLDNFSLASTSKRVELQASSRDECGAVGKAFWSNLDASSESAFKDEDKSFLKSIFNTHLSDRREEGDLFTPPDASCDYMNHLRDLIKEERKVCEKRKDLFYGKNFSIEDPGPLFPFSWKNTFGVIQGGNRANSQPARRLQARPDYSAEAKRIEQVMKTVSPVFDKATEDGTRFRIYQVGNLEVRTTQENEGKEIVGTVYSSHVDSR